MVRLSVQLSADLKNVADLSMVEEYRWRLVVACSNCGETHDDVWVTESELVEVPGGRSEAHVVLKCKACERTNTIKLERQPPAGKPFYTADQSGEFVPVGEFECRGVEITDWSLGAGFTATGGGGAQLDDVDLSDDFYDCTLPPPSRPVALSRARSPCSAPCPRPSRRRRRQRGDSGDHRHPHSGRSPQAQGRQGQAQEQVVVTP